MADLGRKHVCFKCSTKFYDLKKPVALCPKCGANQADAPAVAAPPPPPAPVKRAVRMVDPEPDAEPAGDEPVAEAAEGAEAAEADEEPVGDGELDEPAGEDSYD